MTIKDLQEEKRICEDIIRALDKPRRLIDAEHLKKRATDWWGDCWDNYAQSTEDFLEYIDNEPTVDAEPVRHGQWIGKEDQKWHCSECDGIAPKGYRYNYCPHCGAKMNIDTPTDPVAK